MNNNYLVANFGVKPSGIDVTEQVNYLKSHGYNINISQTGENRPEQYVSNQGGSPPLAKPSISYFEIAAISSIILLAAAVCFLAIVLMRKIS